GFAADQHARPVAEFSGGWRVRLNLARALMCRSDLLLLDEPTNHLDLDAVLWLEQWLRGYPGTLLLISHDRDFLDTVVEGIVHIEHRRLHYYSGDYSAFEQRRAARLAQQQAAYRQQQREIARLQQFVDRFRAKATKARQAQSRLKTLDRLERIAPAHVDSPFRFGFRAPEKLPAPLLAITGGTVGYGATPLLERIRLTLQPGTRLGLLGRNGAGKSTLIKLLAGELELQSGERTEGQGLVTGYFAQHQLEQLRADWSPLAHLQQLDPATDAQSHRDFLGGFGFTGDQALAPSGPFSGGEKARLVLALLVWQRPNLLLLDEPTNHLDLEMRHALTLALQDYAGALVLVAHDRHLLRATCDGFLLVHGGRVRDFDGDLEDYRRWLADSGTGTSATGTSATGTSATGTSATGTSGSEPAGRTGSAGERRERRRQEAERRNRLSAERRPLELELRRLEQRLEQLTGERDALEQALAEPALYADDQKSRLQDLLQRQGETRRELDRVEEDWMALQERWEALADEV
ncbi:MAG: ATP-binding cassette domain-containing protein, partial [Candidatus Competibacterales bacterium]|nr:ATP-binding cassette domain-containing protein [Candidatus Competibacterales bacterium]